MVNMWKFALVILCNLIIGFCAIGVGVWINQFWLIVIGYIELTFSFIFAYLVDNLDE